MSVESYSRAGEIIPLSRSKSADTDLLIREANHRIANSLAGIAALVRLQASEAGRQTAPFSPAKVRDMLREAAARIEAVGRLHRLLSHQPDAEHVDLGAHLDEVSDIIVSSFGQVVLIRDCERHCLVDAAQAGTLSLIVGELITNAAKHARPDGGKVRITVACRRNGLGRITVSVADDGVGLADDFDHGTALGLGMQVIYTLAAQAGATLAFESLPLGLRAELILKA